MKVLWITNITFPEAQELLGGKGALRNSGGWLLGAADALVSDPSIQLTVATVSEKVNNLTYLKGDRIDYYLLPFGRGNNRINHEYEPLWNIIEKEVNPDVVHLHGTEFSHGLAYIEACGVENVCLSIQGLVSACSYYYYYGLSKTEILKATTIHSLLKGGILKEYKDFKKRGEYEIQLIRKVRHIIGRTSWDRGRIWAINPDAVYHYCGETLRSEFYKEPVWNYDECLKHSIFLSQASYPLKGLHMVLRAMPFVLQHYPDATLSIAGKDITQNRGFIARLKLTDYGKIIKGLIKKNNLENCVCFTGPLDGGQMKKEYLKSNVFVCPSSIENSPNSLGEAQVLGVPVVASYAGGIPDMMRNAETYLYRFEEIESLAQKICLVFDRQNNVDTSLVRATALDRHSPSNNVKNLVGIYKTIINANPINEKN